MPLLEPVLAWLEALVPDGLVELVLLVWATTHVAHTNSNNPDNRRFLIVFVFLLLGMWICWLENAWRRTRLPHVPDFSSSSPPRNQFGREPGSRFRVLGMA